MHCVTLFPPRLAASKTLASLFTDLPVSSDRLLSVRVQKPAFAVTFLLIFAEPESALKASSAPSPDLQLTTPPATHKKIFCRMRIFIPGLDPAWNNQVVSSRGRLGGAPGSPKPLQRRATQASSCLASSSPSSPRPPRSRPRPAARRSSPLATLRQWLRPPSSAGRKCPRPPSSGSATSPTAPARSPRTTLAPWFLGSRVPAW